MTNSTYYSATAGIRTSDLSYSMTMNRKVAGSYPLGHRGSDTVDSTGYREVIIFASHRCLLEVSVITKGFRPIISMEANKARKMYIHEYALTYLEHKLAVDYVQLDKVRVNTYVYRQANTR